MKLTDSQIKEIIKLEVETIKEGKEVEWGFYKYIMINTYTKEIFVNSYWENLAIPSGEDIKIIDTVISDMNINFNNDDDIEQFAEEFLGNLQYNDIDFDCGANTIIKMIKGVKDND